jgi:hypothetical protein
MTYEEMRRYLDELYDGLPEAVLNSLNGGIILSPDTKIHPQSIGNDLVINGEYHYQPYGLGRYIVLYYGSLVRSCGHMPEDAQKQKIKEVLYHELTHHLENMAGDKTLEKKDAADLDAYKRKRRNK